jgi:hypothetical protein
MRGKHLETRNFIAGADLSSSEGLVVAFNATIGQVVLATDPDAAVMPVGILLEGNTSGGEVTVAIGGLIETGEPQSGAAITHGTHRELGYDANGKLVPNSTAGDWVVALAELRSNASGADESIVVRAVTPYRYVADS